MKLVCGAEYVVTFCVTPWTPERSERKMMTLTLTYCGGSCVDEDGHHIGGGVWGVPSWYRNGHRCRQFYDLNILSIQPVSQRPRKHGYARITQFDSGAGNDPYSDLVLDFWYRGDEYEVVVEYNGTGRIKMNGTSLTTHDWNRKLKDHTGMWGTDWIKWAERWAKREDREYLETMRRLGHR